MALRMARQMIAALPELCYEPVTRRIRCLVDGDIVVDTTDAVLLWQPRRRVPTYAVPTADIAAELVHFETVVSLDLEPLPPAMGSDNFGLHTCPGEAMTVRTASRDLEGVAFRPDDPELRGRIALAWPPFDWLEEDQTVVGHPHDPFTRIDILPSSRHVTVSLDGVTLADSARPIGLFETLLRTRWYLPRADVRMDLLTPSDTTSVCAYKGHATYFSLAGSRPEEAGRDIAWTYVDPLHEAAPVKDYLCFFSERTDTQQR